MTEYLGAILCYLFNILNVNFASAKHRSVKSATLSVLFGRYAIRRLSQPVYESTSSIIFRAEDTLTSERVAIKLFHNIEHYVQEKSIRADLEVDHTQRLSLGWLNATPIDPPSDAIEALAEMSDGDPEVVALMKSFGGGALVMQPAAYDLHTKLSSSRFGGRNIEACVEVLRPIATNVAMLHSRGVMHGDVKPRNVVLLDGEWKLIDMDASMRIGARIDANASSFKWTSSVSPPELAQRALWSARASGWLPPLVAHPSLDVFMLGALMFEVVTRTSLFGPTDNNDDSLSSEKSRREIFCWQGVDDVRLALCFASCPDADAQRQADCKDLLRGMLHGDPQLRFTMQQVIGHPFLNHATASLPRTREPAPSSRVHFFISCHLEEAEEQGIYFISLDIMTEYLYNI